MGEQSLQPSSTYTFDLTYSLLCSLFIFGQFLDGWAHANLPAALETFFTPWHAVFYAGIFITAGYLFFTIFQNLGRQGSLSVQSIRSSIPKYYTSAAIGFTIFFLGGIGGFHLS